MLTLDDRATLTLNDAITDVMDAVNKRDPQALMLAVDNLRLVWAQIYNPENPSEEKPC